MNWNNILAITLTVALVNLWRAYREKRRAQLAARTEIPAYRNWRGEYVPDLWRIRARRSVVAAWVLLTLAAFPIAYLHLESLR